MLKFNTVTFLACRDINAKRHVLQARFEISLEVAGITR